MKTHSVLLVVALLLPNASAKAAETDAKRLQGTWNAAETKGKVQMTIAKDVIDFRSSTSGEWYKAKFEIDPSSSPKKIFVTIEDGPVEDFKGKTSLGIYRFVGNRLEISACRPGETVGPKGFDDQRCRHAEFSQP